MHIEEPATVQWAAQHAFPTSHTGQTGADYHVQVPFAPSAPNFYHYAQNGLSYNNNNNNYDFSYGSQYPTSSCPRSYNGPDLTGLPNTGMTESYPPTAYQIEPPKHNGLTPLSDHGVNDHLMQMDDDYEHHYGPHIKSESHCGYSSPYSDMTRASTPDEPSKYPHDMMGVDDEDAIDKEQPYAQLIFQALRSAPGHTMILRNIYDWFQTHTDKAAASETKGWQNSIRHNLSMNGAFEKVDQPNEQSRKGFMWRLTQDALDNGVKSTTRYRSKQPNKRGYRHHPQPQRQASGAKGGQAARRSAHLKRSKRVQNEMYRSVPTAFDPRYDVQKTQQYPTSPYYGSDVEFGYASGPDLMPTGNDLSNHNSSGFNPFPQSARSYSASPLLGDSAYVLKQSPSGSLFTNSPSPSALDEPRTPLSQCGWGEQMTLPIRASFVCEGGMGFQEYAG
ncbi:hypothetical protein CC86DRAFT_396670 [Ophiobolus disseminans]|uniref:Fork-head domain-containing protein n=1 Tax=Ophiobolus disseminans TaxID=1469910 RepID=A0A6A6ZPR7_9PLEO|nr:hypothetical protein CC86DRAFT_396670 [Ophiobolus disseminans]